MTTPEVDVPGQVEELEISSVTPDSDREDEMLRDAKMVTLLFEIRSQQISTTKEVKKIGNQVNDLHEQLLKPDTGLYARVRDVERDTKTLKDDAESTEETLDENTIAVVKINDWKESVNKALWFVSFTGLGIFIKYIFDNWLTKK